MELRYAPIPDQIPHFDTTELRERFLVEDLFVPGEINAVYTHHDRIVLGGAVPAGTQLALPTFDELSAEYVLANREVGIVTVGGAGTVTATARPARCRTARAPTSAAAPGTSSSPTARMPTAQARSSTCSARRHTRHTRPSWCSRGRARRSSSAIS